MTQRRGSARPSAQPDSLLARRAARRHGLCKGKAGRAASRRRIGHAAGIAGLGRHRGGGAAGNAAAEMLRREGYSGQRHDVKR